MILQVDAQGVVVTNKWEDCQDGCPGTSKYTHYSIRRTARMVAQAPVSTPTIRRTARMVAQ